jgi:predicted  nucleic acid-binding Zn-ribbon protein
MTRRDEVEDGMGFSGLVPSTSELREERELKRLRAEIERLREEVETWKDRFHAERQDHEATMKAWDEERSGL